MVDMNRSTISTAFALSLTFIVDAGPAHAYIDPGTGSILLQGIIGGAATFLVVLRIYGAKVKRTFLTLIGRGSSRDVEIESKAGTNTAE